MLTAATHIHSHFPGHMMPPSKMASGLRMVITSFLLGTAMVLSELYEVVQPRWFEFWKKPTAVRLMANQIDVLSATPSRDSTGLFVIGRIPGGAMQVYDSKQNRFVPYLGGLPASNLVVSPDKKWMAYSDYPRHFLWRSRLDGSDKLQLTDDYSFMPQWSPDSKSIAFSNLKEIYLVSADGGTAEKLTSEGMGEISPSWWPGGKSIVFNDFPDPGRIKRLKVVDLATRKVSILPGSDGYFLPSWSPDGQYMVATSVNPAARRLVLAADRHLEKPEGIPNQFWILDLVGRFQVSVLWSAGTRPRSGSRGFIN